MKSIKKSIVFILFAVMMMVCLTGCLKVDMGVEIKEDGTAALTTKLFMEEDAYKTLLSLDETASEDPNVTTSGDLDLKSFKKETIDDEVYYTFEETKELKSYEELKNAILSSVDEDGNMFSEVEIIEESENYTFKVVTEKADTSDAPVSSDNWLTISMTVTMPGNVVETNGEQVDENTVKFVMNDFTESHTYSVRSEPVKFGMRDIVLIVAFFSIIIGLIAFLVYRRKKGYKF